MFLQKLRGNCFLAVGDILWAYLFVMWCVACCVVVQDLDQITRVPHLLIEIRSLGFVEIQGKDTGGVYGKLDHWFKEHWHLEDKTRDMVETVSQEQDCSLAERKLGHCRPQTVTFISIAAFVCLFVVILGTDAGNFRSMSLENTMNHEQLFLRLHGFVLVATDSICIWDNKRTR